VLYLQNTIYDAYSDLNLHFIHEVYHTVITIRVKQIFSHDNIISVLSSVNSIISDYKKHETFQELLYKIT